MLTAMQSEAQKREFETVVFAEGEIWGIDILVSSGEDGKVSNVTYGTQESKAE